MKKGDKKDISAKEKAQTSGTSHIPAEHDKHAVVDDHASQLAGKSAVPGKSTEASSAGGEQIEKKGAKKSVQSHVNEARLRQDFGAQAEPAASPQPAHTERKDRKLIDEKLLRLQADFDNFRKRMLREKNELYRRANEELILELLPVFDHMELALAAAEEYKAHGAFIEGFSLVSEQLMSVLKKFGLTPIDAEGMRFDPGRHEAISYIPSDKFPENAVITQVRRGYMLGDKLLRAAQVVVSGGEQKTEGNAERGTRNAEFCPEQTPSSDLRVPSSNADSAQRTTDHGQQTTEKGEE